MQSSECFARLYFQSFGTQVKNGLTGDSIQTQQSFRPSGWRGEINADPLAVWSVHGPAAYAATINT